MLCVFSIIFCDLKYFDRMLNIFFYQIYINKNHSYSIRLHKEIIYVC